MTLLDTLKNSQVVILVFHFDDAPEALRQLSGHGGDEDWIAVVPPELVDVDPYIPWLEDAGSPFGCCEVTQHAHPELPGYMVHIGAHS